VHYTGDESSATSKDGPGPPRAVEETLPTNVSSAVINDEPFCSAGADNGLLI
jgi:hypothetical protein